MTLLVPRVWGQRHGPLCRPGPGNYRPASRTQAAHSGDGWPPVRLCLDCLNQNQQENPSTWQCAGAGLSGHRRTWEPGVEVRRHLQEDPGMDNLLPRGHRPGRARPGRQARRPVFPALCWTGGEKCREARGGPGTWSLNKRRLYNRRFGMSGTSHCGPRGPPSAAAAWSHMAMLSWTAHHWGARGC